MTTTYSSRRRPRITVLAATVALALLFGLAGRVAPAAAAGNASFKNVAVTTTATSATITFTSKVTTGVYVIVGTGLDPSTSQVALVKLPHQASHHYSATVGGLKPSTGYSFRIAAPLVAPYTDIWLLVTKAPYFRNVLASVQWVNATVDFDYDGVGPVTVTLSKSFDFTNHFYRRKVLDVPTSGHHWSASFPAIDAGTGYAFQLYAPDASSTYADITSIVTKHRNVSITYTSFHAIDDGDAWPHGCGDFAYTHKEQGDFYSLYFMTMATYQCVDSGHSQDLTQFPMGHREMTDVKTGDFRTDFWAFDDDQKVGDPECTPDYISNTCGQVAWGYKYVDISTPGNHPFAVHAYGLQNALDVIAYGVVNVTFT